VSYSTLTRLRRLSQVAFLLLFLFLLLKTQAPESLRAARGDIRLPYPAGIFLQTDPLVAISNALATRALYKGLLWSLVIIIPTLFLGRFFCGWVCPLGTLNHFVSNWKSEKKRGRRLVDSSRYHGWQRLKYYVLIAVLAAALFGSALAGLFDPIALTVRSVALSVQPAANYALTAVNDSLYHSGNRVLRITALVLDFVLRQLVLSFRQPYFRQGFFLGLLFLAILALNLRFTRFWCRALCPLGALLGWMSRWSILGLEKHPARCEDCNRCLLHCQGGDDPIPGARWRKAECHLCLNCASDCPEGGLRFRFFPRPEAVVEGPDLQRRKAIAGLAAGAVALPLLRSTPGLAVESSDRLIRPPGALDEKQFLERCVRCGECMKVCPNNALHPSFAQAGLEGIWTPVLVARIGYCEPSCTLCGQVCPTGAIWEFTLQQKGWASERGPAGTKPIRIGTAFYDHGRCLPWSMATDCIVCEEWCPTSPKAVYLRPADVVDAQGNVKRVRQPYIAPELCIGCGACEFACPVRDRPAVYVTSVGESRSAANQILLPKPAAEPAPYLPESGQVAGWSKTGETRSFEAGDLYRYIDGAAERFIQAGVVRALTSGYRYQDKADAVADVYLMRTAEGARKVFESEPATGSRPLPLGDAGRLYGASLTFRKGPCFVRLVAYESGPGIGEALLSLARGIEARLHL
jgi:polyferredoxin